MELFPATAAARIIFKLQDYFFSLRLLAVGVPDTPNGHQNLEKTVFIALLAATASSGGMDLKSATSNDTGRFRALRVGLGTF